MFCPKCAAQNIEGASFCRACGANISLVPQALSGQLPQQSDDTLAQYARRFRRRQPTMEHGITRIMTGLGFIAVALSIAVFAPAGRFWWFWLLLPAFSLIGKGISEILRAKDKQSLNSLTRTPDSIELSNPNYVAPGRSTAELMPPVPSVTEGTTRHLGTEGPTRHFDSLEDRKPS